MKLSDLDSVDLLDKRGYLTVCLSLCKGGSGGGAGEGGGGGSGGKIYLRKADGIRDWHRSIRDCHIESRNSKSRAAAVAGTAATAAAPAAAPAPAPAAASAATRFQFPVASDVDTERFWSRRQVTDSTGMENWIQNRKKKGEQSTYVIQSTFSYGKLFPFF